MSDSSWWAGIWADTTVTDRWVAFREFHAETGGTLGEFLELGPGVRCSWLTEAT